MGKMKLKCMSSKITNFEKMKSFEKKITEMELVVNKRWKIKKWMQKGVNC